MKTKTLKTNINQVQVAKITYATVIVMILAYLFLVNQISFTALSYEDTCKEITHTQSKVSELELSYIELNKNIGEEMANTFALKRESDDGVIFVKRNNTAQLTLNE